MAARNITKKIILFVALLVVAGFFIPQKASAVTRAMDVSLNAYFVDADKPCSSAPKTNINQAGEKTLNLCVGGQNFLTEGFDFNITCTGVVECTDQVETGSDIGLFIRQDGAFMKNEFRKLDDGSQSASYVRGGIIPVPVQINRPLNLAKIKVNVRSLETGSVTISRSDVFLGDDQSVVANVTAPPLPVGASASPPSPTVVPPFRGYDSDQIPEGAWVQDADVTFAGKMASRSASFLGWVLDRYQWSQVGATNPFTAFWKNILNIVYAFALGLVLVSAFVMIWTRGQNITIMRFMPRFILIILLSTFSFTLIKFLYETTDIIQGFFLKHGSTFISAPDLINMDFGYRDFVGYRMYGANYDESVFITVLLTKLTALSYYIMSGVLLVRKVILWFFIIVSPVFPLLLFYPTIRNTAKIWMGEFFRWLLYAPVFAIFLSGLVSFWESYIPLSFQAPASGEEALYPTAANILLGGPGQNVSQGNSINQPDTFILYIISLFMVWIVIILPFILLRIFLDYMQNISFSENSYLKQIATSSFPVLNKYGIIKGPTPPAILPVAPTSFGMAKKLPFINKLPLPGAFLQRPAVPGVSLKTGATWEETPQMTNGMNVNTKNTYIRTPSIKGETFFNTPMMQPLRTTSGLIDRTKQILHQANINIPTIRDIAHIETSLLSNDTGKIKESRGVFERLEKIANPSLGVNASESHQYNSIKDQLTRESSNNNVFAKTILIAASKVSEIKQTERTIDKIRQMGAPVKEQLAKESGNNAFASSVLSQINKISAPKTSKEKQLSMTNSLIEKLKLEKEKGSTLASSVLQAIAPNVAVASPVQRSAALQNMQDSIKSASLPVVNRVQTVSLDDYEAVKGMWTENYQKLEVPQNLEGTQTRKEWINTDIEKISEIIQLLTSSIPQSEKEGMDMVGGILPFLLIGGFSKTEIIAYLKAKLQAAKGVLDQIAAKEEEEETQVGVQKKEEEKEKEMTAETTDEIKDQNAKIKT